MAAETNTTNRTGESVGIVGCGFVGNAIVNGFKSTNPVKSYDIDPSKSSHSIEEVLKCNFIFVCLPTPMDERNGSCDCSFIYDFFKSIKDKDRHNDSIFIIKSTVPIGTTRDINNKFGLENKIVHSAEFLSARTANIDFITAPRYIVGGDMENNWAIKKVKELHKNRFPQTNIFEMSYEESEFTKYLCNCFYASKILFMNEMRMFSDHLGLNWENVIKGFLSSGWVSPMHTQVPGHDGQLGFGGACFPKDINSMAHQISLKSVDNKNLNPELLYKIIERNEEIRNIQ